MTVKIGINGYGRIGRNILRAHYEGGKKNDIQIVAINDLGDAKSNAHLTRYDTAHGKFPGTVEVDGDFMVVNGDKIKVRVARSRGEPNVRRTTARRTPYNRLAARPCDRRPHGRRGDLPHRRMDRKGGA